MRTKKSFLPPSPHPSSQLPLRSQHMFISDPIIGKVDRRECMVWSNQDLPWIRDLYVSPLEED